MRYIAQSVERLLVVQEVVGSNPTMAPKTQIMPKKKCPCGANTTPDPLCDMCDGWQNDPDTGWGGYTNHYLGKHFDSLKDEQEHKDSLLDLDEDEDENEYSW